MNNQRPMLRLLLILISKLHLSTIEAVEAGETEAELSYSCSPKLSTSLGS